MTLRRATPFWAGKKAGGVLPQKTPDQLSGLEAWYDVTDLSTITKDGSDRVTQLNDKSGNIRNLTAPSGQEPLYLPSGFKGNFPCIQGDFSIPTQLQASFSIGSFPVCFFYVASSATVPTGINTVFGYWNSGNRNNYLLARKEKNTGVNVFAFRNASYVEMSGNTQSEDSGVCYIEKTATEKRLIDETTDSLQSDTNAYGSLNTFALFKNSFSASGTNGSVQICELTMYSTIPSDSDKQLIFNYFANKYGILIPTI